MIDAYFNKLFSASKAKELNSAVKRYVFSCIHGDEVLGVIQYMEAAHQRDNGGGVAFVPLTKNEKRVVQKKIITSQMGAAKIVCENLFNHQFKLFPVFVVSAMAALGTAALDVHNILPPMICNPIGRGTALFAALAVFWPPLRALSGLSIEPAYRVSEQSENMLKEDARPTCALSGFFKARAVGAPTKG